MADAKRKLLYMLAGGAALGGAARGGMGLLNLARRNAPKPKPAPLPQIGMTAEDEDQIKMAAKRSWLGGGSARELMEIPWFPPAAAAAGLGGAYGGWKMFDKLMDDRRKSEQDQELAAAKMKFQQALSDTSSPKYAEDNDLGVELDGLFDQVKEAMESEKTADDCFEKAAVGRTAGQVAGLYGLYALLAGGAVGNYAYRRAKRKTGPEVLDAAMERRKRMRSLAKPTPVFLQSPTPPIEEEEEQTIPSPVTQDNGLLGFDSAPSRTVTRQY